MLRSCLTTGFLTLSLVFGLTLSSAQAETCKERVRRTCQNAYNNKARANFRNLDRCLMNAKSKRERCLQNRNSCFSVCFRNLDRCFSSAANKRQRNRCRRRSKRCYNSCRRTYGKCHVKRDNKLCQKSYKKAMREAKLVRMACRMHGNRLCKLGRKR